MMNTTRPRIAAGLILLAVLAGCSKSTPDAEPPEADNVGAEVLPNTVQPVPEPSETAKPVPAPRPSPIENVAAAPAEPEVREAPPSPDAQMLEDADATGMTARSTRGEAPANDSAAP